MVYASSEFCKTLIILKKSKIFRKSTLKYAKNFTKIIINWNPYLDQLYNIYDCTENLKNHRTVETGSTLPVPLSSKPYPTISTNLSPTIHTSQPPSPEGRFFISILLRKLKKTLQFALMPGNGDEKFYFENLRNRTIYKTIWRNYCACSPWK